MSVLASSRLLRGKTACITGGTTGIGRAIALEYLRQGANVAVNHLDLPQDSKHKHSLLEAAKEIKSRGASEGLATGALIDVPGDITKPETGHRLVQEAVGKCGAIDVFVANAGIFRACEFLS